jgi:hypothetical protein
MLKITLKNFRKIGFSFVKQKQAPFSFISDPITQLDARKKNFKMNKDNYENKKDKPRNSREEQRSNNYQKADEEFFRSVQEKSQKREVANINPQITNTRNFKSKIFLRRSYK